MQTDPKDQALEQLRQVAEELKGIRFRLLGMAATLPEYREEEEPDRAMDARNLTECLVYDYVEPAIRDIGKLLAEEPKG
jgi:hypothetical protein